MQLQLILKLVVLLAIANGAPIFANKLMGAALAYPFDMGGGASLMAGPSLDLLRRYAASSLP